MTPNRDIFGRLGERERRNVFDKPLSEIVRLLEFNLLEKFWQIELQLQGVVLLRSSNLVRTTIMFIRCATLECHMLIFFWVNASFFPFN